jgi:hypothetical protein
MSCHCVSIKIYVIRNQFQSGVRASIDTDLVAHFIGSAASQASHNDVVRTIRFRHEFHRWTSRPPGFTSGTAEGII